MTTTLTAPTTTLISVESPEREIMVVKRDNLFPDGECFNGFVSGSMFTLRHIKPCIEWKNKKAMETDKSYKQIIPYLLLHLPSENKIMRYVRGDSGGEARLHQKYSIGIGGHVERSDNPGGVNDQFSWIIHKCLRRELEEEIVLEKLHDLQAPELVGFVNEDVTDVGCVHFGLVFSLRLKAEQTRTLHPREDSIKDVEFCNTEDMLWANVNRPYELWSDYILGALRASRSRFLYGINVL